MQRRRLLSIALLIVLMLGALPFNAVYAEPVEICEKWGKADVLEGEYTLQNNIWGADTAQCISADTDTASFTVTQSAHNQGAVASYPSLFKGCHWGDCTANSGMPLLVNEVQNAPFNWSVSGTNAAGVWNAAAEAWFSDRLDSTDGYDGGAELMIWIDYQGMQPAGSQVATVSIAGATWEVWYANIGWNYIAYRRMDAASSIDADLKDFIADSVARGWIQSSWYLHDFEAGFELMTDGAGLTTDAFSFAVNADVPTPTPTEEPTQTPDPTPTGTPDPNAELKVQYRAADTNAGDNQIKPHINIVNHGSSSVSLSELTVRYWYTIDGVKDQQYHCDYAQIDCNNVSGQFVQLASPVTGADHYLEISFSGGTLAAGGQTGEIQNRFHKSDWSNYDESDDYAFDATKTALADWDRVTLYRNGQLVWGTEPDGSAPDPTPTPDPTPDPTPTPTEEPTVTPTPTPTEEPTPTPTPDPNADLKVQYRAGTTDATTNQIRPHVNVVNQGSTSVSLSELTLRYWYTIDGVKDQQYHCDYAQIGCSNVSGQFVQLASPVSGADHYLEVSFSGGTLTAGGQTGEIQNRFNKSDWSSYGQSDDYSFDATKTAFADWDRVTLYQNGAIVWGTEPDGSAPDPTPTPTPTEEPTVTPTPTPTEDPTPPPPGTHVANPFDGAQGYVNPDYAAQVAAEAANAGGTLGDQMLRVADYSTAVWMDRIGAITEGRGLRGHLDAALTQQSGDTPVTIMVVIYDLPNRDCAALASNGELLVAEDGINRYQTEYIDPIVEILSDPAYSELRIVTIIEPDSLPNLITNLDKPLCAEADSSGAYAGGIQYAINQLHTLPNVYIYLDIAHSGWLGWSSNFDPAVQLYTQVVQNTNDGLNSIDGFITNVANYTPVDEVFLPDPDLMVGGMQIKSADFFEWNPYFDELDFATDLRAAFISAGFPSDIGMLVDTSRNGWGGSARPTEVSTATQVDPYVDESRIDRRPHRGGWCNQAGAGIGARPQVTPAPGIDAYVWVKPPGESDGVSESGIPDPTDPNKQFDGMCDPNAQSTYDPAYPTNALPNAPHAGRWFPEQFQMLVENAYPLFQP